MIFTAVPQITSYIVYPVLVVSFTWVALCALFRKDLANITTLSRRKRINLVYLVIFRNFMISLQRVCVCESLRLCPVVSLRQSDSNGSANRRPTGYFLALTPEGLNEELDVSHRLARGSCACIGRHPNTLNNIVYVFGRQRVNSIFFPLSLIAKCGNRRE